MGGEGHPRDVTNQAWTIAANEIAENQIGSATRPVIQAAPTDYCAAVDGAT
jgi:hypothetical protein